MVHQGSFMFYFHGPLVKEKILDVIQNNKTKRNKILFVGEDSPSVTMFTNFRVQNISVSLDLRL